MSEMNTDPTANPANPANPPLTGTPAATEPPAKERFAKALDEAKAGAQQLGKEAQERVGVYKEKVSGARSEWVDEAKSMTNQAKDQAFILANEGKARASEAISGLGKLVEENAATIDAKVGVKYGDYARSAARGMQDAATKLETRELGELGEDAKDFVRKSPGIAVGIAAALGFMVSRMFKKSGN